MKSLLLAVCTALNYSLALASGASIESGSDAASSSALDARLPVLVLGETTSDNGAVYDAELAPALVSHFLADGRATLTGDSERVLRAFPSRFLNHGKSVVVLVDGLDLAAAEAKWGTPPLWLAADAAATFENVPHVSLAALPAAVAAGEQVVRVDAMPKGSDANEHILALLAQSGVDRTLVVGLPQTAAAKASREAEGVVTQTLHSLTQREGKSPKNASYVSIPATFESEDECVADTNSCTGRGSCVKLSSGRYACRCTSTVVDEYTYYWGGNDCSKRNLGFQFHLLVGTTIAILVAGALSVGLLFRLGSEPLPSVLSTSTL